MCSMCSATQAVKCGVASSSPSSLASVSLSFRSTCTILLYHIFVLILLVVILYQFIQFFTRSHFPHWFSLYSHGILGVVFTEHKQRSGTQAKERSASSKSIVAESLLCYGGPRDEEVSEVIHENFDEKSATTTVASLSC